jgi:hypothetical protein
MAPGARMVGIAEGKPPVVDALPTVGVEMAGGEVTTGTVGAGALTVGAIVTVGTAAAELTPRLLISVESRGMPTLAVPPGVSGDVGVEEAATLTEPEPHMPDKPDVSIMADVVGMLEDVDIAGDGEVPAVDIRLEPVAGAMVPSDVPPPS